MNEYFWIAFGGAIGTMMRYGVYRVGERFSWAMPWGTLAVNLAGCFAIGLLSALFLGPWPLRSEWRLGLTVGLLGGFTTFSTFGLETYRLLQSQQMRLATLYVLASCLGGLLAVACGDRLGQWLGRAA